MSIWARFAAPFRKSVAPLDTIPGAFMRPETQSGVAVNWQNALDTTTVIACVRVIAEGIASPPIRYYSKSLLKKGVRRRVDPPIAEVLSQRPNSWQTPFEFIETLMFHLVLTGNAFAFKSYVDNQIHELIPIEPGRVTVTRQADLSLTYRVTAENGSFRDMTSREIWHIRGPSWNSWLGMEAVKYAREAIGLSMALEKSHAQLHRNGAKISGLYSVTGALSPERYAQLKAWFEKEIGDGGAYRPMIMDQDAKYSPLVMTGVDSQHLETRRHQTEEICRAFRVLPIMVGHAGNTAPTYASSEQFFIAHVVHTLSPWATRLEQSIETNLVEPADDIDARFYLRSLMRGASKDRAEYNAKALGSGGSPAWATVNEIREDDDLDWIAGGDELPKPVVAKPGAA